MLRLGCVVALEDPAAAELEPLQRLGAARRGPTRRRAVHPPVRQPRRRRCRSRHRTKAAAK
eukprot:1947428-Prymnesium_polylepis.1